MELVRAVAFLMAAGAAFGATLALGGAVNDKFDIFAQAAPLWFLIAAASLVLQAPAQGGRGGQILAAWAVLVTVALMAPDISARFSMRSWKPEQQTVKVIQFNVWDRNRDPLATARWIASQDADIVVLEETGDGAVPAMLAKDYPSQTPCKSGCATVILSRTAPVAGGAIGWPGLGPRHAGAWASFGKGRSAFTVAGTHYRWPIPAGPQSDQARRFAEFLRRFDKKNLIVAGDFNLNPWSFGLRRQDSRFGLDRLTHAMLTWPVGDISHWRVSFPFPFLAVDHIYAGADWRPVSVKRGPALGSDHYPVIAVLTR